MFDNVKYSRLPENGEGSDPTLEVSASNGKAFSFDSAFKYDVGPKDSKYNSTSNYNSAFKYSGNAIGNNKNRSSVALDMSNGTNGAYAEEGYERNQTSWGLVLTTWVLTILSYVCFILTSPITYFIFVKKLGEFDRLVVFRLGKMIGVKGPGRVLVFPWLDRTKKIDVRAAAFAVPPQQFITCDGGIVEMGAEIQYGIVDVITMVSEVADHQDILRSLGKTILIKILVKKTVSQLEKDKRMSSQVIQDELNCQVRKWGIDVQRVELSGVKVLKEAENSSSAAVGSILKGLGMKEDPEYPTPQEFVRATHGLENDKPSTTTITGLPADNPAANHVSAMGCMPPPQIPEGANNLNLSLLQMMSGVSGGISKQEIPGVKFPTLTTSQSAASKVCNWGKCLEAILQSEFKDGTILEEDACGLYKIEITETESGKDTYYIEMNAMIRCVKKEIAQDQKPDVSVTISSQDLSSVLEGSLAPLQAYLTGRISANGDVRKLMLFDKLSRRGHKPGSMFNV